MKWRGIDILTILIVTFVTVLIWMIAEVNTRETSTMTATIEFMPPGQGQFLVAPQRINVELGFEGPPEALQRMTRRLRDVIQFPISGQGGLQQIDDLGGAIMDLDSIRETGASIISADPNYTDVQVEELVTLTATVRALLPPGSTVENVQVNQDVEVTLLATEANRLPKPLIVDAEVDRAIVEQLVPGLHTLEETVRLPRDLGTFDSATFNPPKVEVTFRLVSRVKTIPVERVRIQVNSAPEDFGEYLVKLPEQFLHDVQVEANADIVAQLEQDECQVFAVVYLSTNDKERRLESKPVAYFTVLCRDGTGEVVNATVAGEAHPEVKLEITSRAAPTE
ncbi:MAG: hypothetical protein VX527_00530 [Planctomycetota bacterium]|nr:hypothetical protein [Planctomycetota bacterium]